MIADSPSQRRSLCFASHYYMGFAAFVVVGALLAIPLLTKSAFVTRNAIQKNPVAVFDAALPQNRILSSIINFQTPPGPFSSTTVATFASDCTTPKTVFNLQDADLTVCAKFTNASPGWLVIWSNANSTAVQTGNITEANSSATFTLNPGSSLGDWRVIIFEPFGGAVYAVASFTVVDSGNPTADLAVTKNAIGGASANSQLLFSINVTNHGPSDAGAVELSEMVPANTTFVSFQQLAGPTFTCVNPNEGETGNSVCQISTLARGESATFIATYMVGAVATGTLISNTASVTSSTPDQNDLNDSASASLEVRNAPCQLSTPDNITVNADPGQAGAVVTYTNPTGTGFCGSTIVGEGGETIPAISCNPTSGSFFPVGTTPVLCFAQTGTAVTFQVTVDNPGALSISLNGNDSITAECGQQFSDPGAVAIDGGGQPLDVTISYTGGFSPDAPATGTYTATYTATEGANSVSTTRTIIVEDTVGPSITIAGANPYRIQQGSCSPFVDPGASAFDTCTGAQAVTSSISGPGGSTSVDPNIPGTYMVTYTATDGTHQTTATRTVIVGDFPADEVDQPGTNNIPPTLVLNGDDQITIECGTAFTDPGATATVCNSPVTVTTSGTVNPNAPGTYSITYSATANGFTTEATRLVTVQDTLAPVITLLGANPMQVGFGTVFTDPGATASDGCAGNLTSSIVVTGGVNTNVVGFYALTYTVSDPAGHTDTEIRTVEVLPYNFTGFFAPIQNPPTVNQKKGGQAVPIKFSLGGNQGLNIFAAGSPASVQTNCVSGDPIGTPEEIQTPGQSSLSYDPGSDQYNYVWKTEKSWKNTCRELRVTLIDGTVHTAKFKFK